MKKKKKKEEEEEETRERRSGGDKGRRRMRKVNMMMYAVCVVILVMTWGGKRVEAWKPKKGGDGEGKKNGGGGLEVIEYETTSEGDESKQRMDTYALDGRDEMNNDKRERRRQRAAQRVVTRQGGSLVKDAVPVVKSEVDEAVRLLKGRPNLPRRATVRATKSEGAPGVTDGFALKAIFNDRGDGGSSMPPEWLCQFELDGHYYNLSPLFEASKTLNASFVIEDVRGGQWDEVDTRYTYYIGFCQDVFDVPGICETSAKTLQMQEEQWLRAQERDGEDISRLPRNIDTAAVYQVSNAGAKTEGCHKLGSVSQEWSFRFLDHRRPTQGITLTYKTGDVCTKRVTNYDKTKGTTIDWVQTHRIVNINVRCNRRDGNLELSEPDSLETAQSLFKMSNRAGVSEKEMCVYNINIPSVYGCPLTIADKQEGSLFMIDVLKTIIWIVIMLGLVAAGVQMYRHQKRMSVLIPLIFKGDQGAWDAFQKLLLTVDVRERDAKKTDAQRFTPSSYAPSPYTPNSYAPSFRGARGSRHAD